MKHNEYLRKLEEILKRHRVEVRSLVTEYGLSQSPLQIGDFATDHMGTIKIEAIDVESQGHGTRVRCVYYGPCFTKKNRPFKSGEKRAVYQTNLKGVGENQRSSWC